jgi:integrase
MILSEALDQFLRWCALARADNTTKLYRGRLKSLGKTLGPLELAAIERLQIEEWLFAADRWPDGRLMAPDTRRANAISFSVFQKWIVDRKMLAVPWIDKIEKPAGRLRERIPTPAETEQILANAAPDFLRMYKALRQSGARPGELCRATIADLKRDQGVILLAEHKTAAKTGRPRRIAVGSKLRELVDAAIGDRTEGPIFLRSNGKAWKPSVLSAAYRKLRDEAKLPRELVLYLARHEHATQLCQKLGIHEAAESLGHSSIKTTQRYLHTTDAERAANQDVFE